MWPSKFEFWIRVRTAECHGPQSCLHERSGTYFVEGNEELKEVGKVGLTLVRGGAGTGGGGKGGGKEAKGREGNGAG